MLFNHSKTLPFAISFPSIIQFFNLKSVLYFSHLSPFVLKLTQSSFTLAKNIYELLYILSLRTDLLILFDNTNSSNMMSVFIA